MQKRRGKKQNKLDLPSFHPLRKKTDVAVALLAIYYRLV
jgi:hypothetical protein